MTTNSSGRQPVSRAALVTFLGLTLALSAVFWWLTISERTGRYIFWLMWSPGTSALVTRLIFQRNLRGQGWAPGPIRWLSLGYLLPVAYALVAYGAVWAAGLGEVDLSRFQTPVMTFVFVGSFKSILSATGEELGWRGFLVPALAQRFSLAWTGIISGLIWSVWHYPLIVLANYNAGTSTGYAIICFTLMVVSLGVILAWLRQRSNSVWPAALLHASHNLFIQGFLDRVTVDTGSTLWYTTEFGAALAIVVALTAWLFWRRRAQIDGVPA